MIQINCVRWIGKNSEVKSQPYNVTMLQLFSSSMLAVLLCWNVTFKETIAPTPNTMVIMTSDPSMVWATAALCVPSPGSCTRTARGASSRSRCSNERRASSEPELWSPSKQRAWQAPSCCCRSEWPSCELAGSPCSSSTAIRRSSGGGKCSNSAFARRSSMWVQHCGRWLNERERERAFYYSYIQ